MVVIAVNLYVAADGGNLYIVCIGFNARTEHTNPFEHLGRNKNFLLVIGALLVLQFLFVTFGGAVLSVEPLSWTAWLVCLLIAFLIIPIDIIRKAITSKKK